MDYIKELRKLIGPRKIILNCAGALIIRDGKILFQRRADNGKWGLVGGLLEMNETYEEAALREVLEETGLEVRLDSFLGIFHNHHMVWRNGDAAFEVGQILKHDPRGSLFGSQTGERSFAEALLRQAQGQADAEFRLAAAIVARDHQDAPVRRAQPIELRHSLPPSLN